MQSFVAAAILASAAVACGRVGVGVERAAAPPNVLLVTIDTFRADRLGVGVAPVLDRLAELSVRFTNARAAVPLTLPSHTTILTGLLPPAHGVRENGTEGLNETHQTIAPLLKNGGYQTAAFVGAFVLDRRFGLARGFDTYDDQIPRDPAATERLEAERPAQVVVDRALAWLNGHVSQQGQPAVPAPFFVWIHLYDPHAPYAPPPEFLSQVEAIRRQRANPESRIPNPESLRYDAEIAYADAQLGRLFDWLRTRQLMERTLVVVAGDHGEGLGDHGERTHGMLLYDSTLRVPLMLVAPGHAPSRRDEAVSLRDLAPTVLRAVGVAPPTEMEGQDLLGEVRLPPSPLRGYGGPGKADATYDGGRSTAVRGVRRQPDLYAETEYPRVAGWASLQALTDGRWKTIRASAAYEVYDLHNDPSEERNVASTQATIATAMAAQIDAVRATAPAPHARTISPEAEERLRALGYVASSTRTVASSNLPNPTTKIADWNAFEDALSELNGHRSGALQALSTLAAANPDAPVFQTTYARALKDAGDVNRALLVYREAARRWPTDATLLHDLAVAAREAALRASGATAATLRQEAARADAAAVSLAPASAMAHNGLGLLAVDGNRPADAVAEFERATAIDANNASYWANLGNARRSIADRAGAEQAYRRAIEVDPRTVDAANGLGVLLVEAQRPLDALPWFERALAAAPDFVEARLNLGIAQQQSGNLTQATQEYRRVLAAPAKYKRERDAAAKLLASLGARR